MKRIISALTAIIYLIISANFVCADELNPITAAAENGKYVWNFADGGEAANIYETDDEYAKLRVSLGTGDSITADKGIYFSDSSCKEPPTSATDSERYILIKPAYSGKLYLKIQFTNASNSAKGRIWYNDFGTDTSMADADLSTLKKGVGTQIGSDFTNAASQTLSFDVEAEHLYSLHTYNRTSYISALYYESENIVGKTAKPTIKTPVTAADTSISGTCVSDAEVFVKINSGEQQTATVTGTEWELSELTLNEGDIISVTAKTLNYKESDEASATVAADDSVCSLTIADTANGKITSNLSDNSRVSKGSTVILTVAPDDKYRLLSLTVGGVNVAVDENNQYSFIIDDNTEVSAMFEAIPYHTIIMPSETENGSISIESGAIDDNGNIKAAEGERVAFNVKPDSGYRIKTLAYTTESGEAKEFKYGNFIDMPSGDITINAEFKQEDTVSYVDTSFNTYDRLTLMVDDKPFFFNGIQVRADNAIGQLGFGYDKIKEMYLQAGRDGYTVVNSQIRWSDVQHDTEIYAAQTGQISDMENIPSEQTVTVSKDGDSRSVAYFTFNLPDIEENAEYAAVKFRVRVKSVTSNTSLSIYDATDGAISSEKVTSPDWALVTSENLQNTDSGSNGYFDFNVADFVNAHKNENSVTLAVACDNDSSLIIYGAQAEGNDRPQLKLSRNDVYDWTHLDKILDFAYEAGVKFELLWFATDTCQQSHEVRLPYYVHANYQKCLKADGTPARNLNATNLYIMCKNDLDLRAKEKEVLEAVFDHIADYTAEKGYGSLVVGCQVANETAVGRLHSGTDDNKYFGHCYCDVCMDRLENSKSEAAYRQDTLWEYLNNLSSAVKESKCSVWTRENNYMTTDTNVLAYNEEKRNTTGTDIDFIGVDPYSVTGGADHNYIYSFGHESCTYRNHTYNYAQGKNLPMAMEFGGNNQDLDESVVACIAGGGYLNVYELLSGKEDFGTYVADSGSPTGFKARTDYTYKSGSEVNWSDDGFIERVRNMNAMLNKVQYQLASKKSDGAGGDSLVFFNPLSDNTSETKKMVRSIPVIYNTDNNGVGIAIEESDKEIVLLSTKASGFKISGIGAYEIAAAETGYFDGTVWQKDKDKEYTETDGDAVITLDAYECVKITVKKAIPSAEDYSPDYIREDNTYTYPFNQFADSRSLAKGAKISNLKIYGATGDYINPSASVYKNANGNDTSEGGIWWNGKSVSGNRYVEYTPEKNGTLTMRLRRTYNAGSTAKSWLRYGTDKPDGNYIGYSDELNSQGYQTMIVELEKGKTYYFWPVNSGVNISSFVFETEAMKDEDIMTYSESDNTVTSLLDGTLIIAEYNDDILTNVKIQTVQAEESVQLDTTAKCKIMLWDSLNGMKPLTNSPLELAKRADYVIQATAESEETVINTSNMVKSGNITCYMVTTAKDRQIIESEIVSVSDSVTVNTAVGNDIEIAPVYEYSNLGNCREGIILDEMFPDGNYNITVTNGSTAHTDVYVNGYMIANNIDQNGDGRSVSQGSPYTANDINVSDGKITVKTADTSDGTLSYVKIVKSPSIAERKTKIYVMGDSLVANYYGGNTDNYLGTTQTGWGQTLANYINTDKYEVVNLANSGYYASNFYTTAFPAILHNSQEGDVFIFEAGVNDYYQPNSTAGGSENRDNMKTYAARIAKEAKKAGLNTILVNPNVTASQNQFGETMLFSQIMLDTASEQNVQSIDLTRKTYNLFMNLYDGDLTKIKASFGVAKDNTHTSYLGAMKYASIVAGELYKLGYTDMINTEFEYIKTDKDGNEIICKAEIE